MAEKLNFKSRPGTVRARFRRSTRMRRPARHQIHRGHPHSHANRANRAPPSPPPQPPGPTGTCGDLSFTRTRNVALGGAINNTWCWFSTDAAYSSSNEERCHDSYVVPAHAKVYILAAHQRPLAKNRTRDRWRRSRDPLAEGGTGCRGAIPHALQAQAACAQGGLEWRILRQI